MTFEILPWQWIVFGIALMISEIFLTTFFILWFGAAAVAVRRIFSDDAVGNIQRVAAI